MKQTTSRLIFIDIIRAFAICMMLEGHFIDGLLAPEYRDENNLFYATWHYIRGMTAPVFFTVSGFIFTYLLIKEQNPAKMGWNHVRVQKGVRRGINLIIIAYLLRANILNLFTPGYTDMNVRRVDVLHCIGLSLLFLIAFYLLTYRRKNRLRMSIMLLGTTFVAFFFEPIYSHLTYEYLPMALANYFTKENDSVFTIFPWFGYASLGGFMGFLFYKNRENPHLYRNMIIWYILLGVILITFPYWMGKIADTLQIHSLQLIAHGDYLIKRIGNVLLFFALFMILRHVITSPTLQKIGQNTLSIYVIHYIILYGSFTGMGLYRYFHDQLTPWQAIIGAILFVIVTILITFLYMRKEALIDEKIDSIKAKIYQFLRRIGAIFVKQKY
ncbi:MULTISPECIES: heparan-alpha-glucosaminide N-acetyltransferase domain-containing protein [Capnocytophaga]|jgi:putative membrane protein|uniref:heparan-alpha-glucosaminide N-acetyltransferase domain-containing protein n=1 Tax=Capnocytophaga TaxID=1016 RepID=UPI00027C65F5|nr:MULTISPECIES: heparan-alpha-glucosaminide N-acetyltransferase domain-containing protein [Capnocytophaga]EJU25664.1 PF07786 family protein [Capnocytophaga sp. CM59]